LFSFETNFLFHYQLLTSSPWPVTLSWQGHKLDGEISGDNRGRGAG